MPARIRSAISRAALPPNTDEPSPYLLSFASLTASSSERDALDRDHRTERLVAHHLHAVIDVGQHGRLDVAAADRVGAAGEDLRALRDRVLEVILDDRDLRRARHRAEVAVVAADLELAHLLDDLVDEPVVHRARRRRRARPRCRPGPRWSARRTRTASAAFARSASSATIIGSLPPSSSSTGVRRSAAAIITRLPVAAEPVNAILSTAAFASAAPVAPAPVTTWSRSGSANVLRRDLGELDRDQRRQLARLEHDRVAGGERVRDRAHRREQRVVPRADHADHAERVIADRRAEVREHARGDLLRCQRGLGARDRVLHVTERHQHLGVAPRARACRSRGGSGRRARRRAPRAPCGTPSAPRHAPRTTAATSFRAATRARATAASTSAAVCTGTVPTDSPVAGL